MTKTQLLEEAAFILEQEGWLLQRLIHENPNSRRLKAFSERYVEWQTKVRAYREGRQDWPEPPDNS